MTGVGKTSLSMRYCNGICPEDPSSTIGASFLQRRLLVGNTEVNIQIWDTAGQERFRAMAPMYYRSAKAAILVFDMTKIETFKRINQWARDVKQHSESSVVLCLVGNKSDLTSSSAVSIEECEELAASLDVSFFSTSAKTGDKVNELFEHVVHLVVDKYTSSPSRDISKDIDVLNLGARINAENQSSCC